MSIWVVYKDGEQIDATPEQVSRWLEEGVINEYTQVFLEGNTDWVNLGAVVGLLPPVQKGGAENGRESAPNERVSVTWEYLESGQVIGPVDEVDLRVMLVSGGLRPSTPIRPVAGVEAKWQPALAVMPFKDALQSGPQLIEKTVVGDAKRPDMKSPESTLAGPGDRRLLPSAPTETVTAAVEGRGVVTWMWILCFASWASCFLPVPLLSTFLVWLFAGIAGTLAFVAFFKNRVAAGIAGTVALVFVTPLVYLLSLSFYASMLTKEISEHEKQRRSSKTEDARASINRAGGSQATSGPPATLTQRDPCLEYKCGGYTAQVRGGGFKALADYQRINDFVSVPSGTSFTHLDTVVVTELPTKASFKKRFVDRASGYVFNKGDLIYLYTSRGLGCWTAWSNGRGFSMSGSKGSADGDVLCFEAYEEEEFLYYLQEGVRKAWNYAEFTMGDEKRKLYYDPEAMRDLNCIPNYSC